MEQTLEAGGYVETGEKLCALALEEYLHELPQYSNACLGCSFHDYVSHGRFEEAFASLAGSLWKNGKHFSDRLLKMWEAFLLEFRNPFRKRERGFVYEAIHYQRALPKE